MCFARETFSPGASLVSAQRLLFRAVFMARSISSVSQGSLEELGLYNVLTRVAQGHVDIDPFLLSALREKGFVQRDAMALTHDGTRTMRALTVRLGWFYPDSPARDPDRLRELPESRDRIHSR